VQVVGEVQQAEVARQLLIEQSVMVAADIVGNVAVKDVGEDQRRWTVSCGLISPSRSHVRSAGSSRTYDDRVHALWKRTRHGRLLSTAAATAMRELARGRRPGPVRGQAFV
jgi:hypothetical protein